MSFDSLESSRPISFEVFNSRQIKQAFDAISYAKGKIYLPVFVQNFQYKPKEPYESKMLVFGQN